MRMEIHIRMILQLIVYIHHMQDVHKLTLVLMKTLHHHIKNGICGHFDTVVLTDVLGKALLVVALDGHELGLYLRIIGINLQLLQLIEICDPLVADLVGDPGRQLRIRMQQPSSLGDTVGLVGELLRIHLIEVMECFLLQDLGMKLCHTVYRMTTYNGQVCHLHNTIIDDGHLGDLVLGILRVLLADILAESPVDLLHDLVDTRQKLGEQLDGPLLQGLSHDGMVGVSAGLDGDVPSLIPLQVVVVHEDTHQLGHSHSRVGVVHLESHLLIEMVNVAVVTLHILLHCGVYRCTDEEVLLAETQLLAGIVVVVRIQHLYDIAGHILRLHGLLVVTFIKLLQMEGVLRLSIPDTEGIHHMVAVAHHRCIIGNGNHGLIALLHEMQLAVLVDGLYPAAEAHFLGKLCPTQLEGIAVPQPVIRHLSLVTVGNLLLEHTVLITDTAAAGPVAQGCQGIQEAGSQTSQTAVAQCPIRLLVLERGEIQSQLLDGLADFLMCTEVDDVVAQCPSHQELHREIIHSLVVMLFGGLLCCHPVIDDGILHSGSYRMECFLIVQLFQIPSEELSGIALNLFLK